MFTNLQETYLFNPLIRTRGISRTLVSSKTEHFVIIEYK